MRIAQSLNLAYHKPNDEFIRTLFRLILHRDADAPSLYGHLSLMQSGYTKNNILLGLINGVEAKAIYFGPPALGNMPTVANKLRHMLSLPPDQFVHSLYDELLCRLPDPGGFLGHVQQLEQGQHPMELVNIFLTSDEWRLLFQSDRNTFAGKMVSHFLSRS